MRRLLPLLCIACNGGPLGSREDCTDGVDNNEDGLVDCEDARCFDDAVCAERDCEDGEDGDGDGVTDCDDEDCWGSEACPAAFVQVQEGEVYLRESHGLSYLSGRWWSGTYSGYPFGTQDCSIDRWTSRQRAELTVTELRGRARFAATESWTCSWTARELRWAGWGTRGFVHDSCAGEYIPTYTTSAHSSSIVGLEMSPGCPFALSRLPDLGVGTWNTTGRYMLRFSEGWPRSADGRLSSLYGSASDWQRLPNGYSPMTYLLESGQQDGSVERWGSLRDGEWVKATSWSGP